MFALYSLGKHCIHTLNPHLLSDDRVELGARSEQRLVDDVVTRPSSITLWHFPAIQWEYGTRHLFIWSARELYTLLRRRLDTSCTQHTQPIYPGPGFRRPGSQAITKLLLVSVVRALKLFPAYLVYFMYGTRPSPLPPGLCYRVPTD